MSDKNKFEGLKLEELHEKRNKIIHDQREMVDKAQEEKREFSSEEDEKYNKMDADFDELTDYIKTYVDEAEAKRAKELREKKLAEREAFMKESQGRVTKTDPNNPDPNKDKRGEPCFAEYRIKNKEKFDPIIERFRTGANAKRSTVDYLNAYTRYLISGVNNIPSEQKRILSAVDTEIRALQADLDTAGGYLVVPEQMVMQVIEELDNIVFMRQYADTISLPAAASLGAPARDTDVGDLTWTAELGTGSEDSDLDFGKREMRPHPLARRIKASKRLLRVAYINVPNYISKRFAFKKGAVEENAFMNGNGVNQPLGIFIDSDSGIPASRNVSTDNGTTQIKSDGLINCKYNLKKQYRNRPGTRWIYHRDAIKMIRKLKDGNGQYIWKQGLSDKPDTILEIPFEESEYAPNTFTTGKIVGILGDLSYYWIVDSLDMEIQVLAELYAESNQMGYICRSETDGQPTQPEAFSRVKLA